MNKLNLADEILTCCDCGEVFVFTSGEQTFFKSKLLSPPKRCPKCREERKARLVPSEEFKQSCENCCHLLPSKLCSCREIADMANPCYDWKPREGNNGSHG